VVVVSSPPPPPPTHQHANDPPPPFPFSSNPCKTCVQTSSRPLLFVFIKVSPELSSLSCVGFGFGLCPAGMPEQRCVAQHLMATGFSFLSLQQQHPLDLRRVLRPLFDGAFGGAVVLLCCGFCLVLNLVDSVCKAEWMDVAV